MLSKTFGLWFDDQIPSGTAQMKRYDGRSKRFFMSRKLQQTYDTYMEALSEHRPECPIQGAVQLGLIFCYSIKDKKKRGKYKTSRPDCDNVGKILIDCMTRSGFWLDDCQIVRLNVTKQYSEGERAYIIVDYKEVFDD